jgi:excisionase family DNA binding protein
MKSVLTTGDVARYCHVSIPTVCGWIRNGHLPAYTLPNGHHRVLPSEFQGFLERHGMPIPQAFLTDGEEESRILIVDDEPQIVDTLTRALTRDDPRFNVASTHHGFEAGMLVASFQPHLVILDLMMPGFDGFQVCQLIRDNRDTAHIRILVITGFAGPRNMERLPALGVDDIMVKPLDLSEFLSRVKRLLSAGPRRGGSEQHDHITAAHETSGLRS